LRTRTDAQRIGFLCYAGRSLDELRAIMQDLHDAHLRPWISTPVRERLEGHRSAGDRLVILTASAFFFAEPIARELSIEKLIGTRVAFQEGRCTGLVEGDIVEGPAKLTAARVFAEQAGVPLSACAFYSDHVADLPLLEAVGRPVAVGSSRTLLRVARQRGWPIVAHGR
jgi:putative phosphoserine phosphatase/1-acylglycerol-3-phosphate O-acyltransferase